MKHGVAMKYGVAMKHGGRARVDFHPLGQGRDVWDDVTPQKAF